MRATHEVAQLLRQHWQQVEAHPRINSWQLRTLAAIMRCRTQAMGGHVDACTACGSVRISYNSCRNRHCPKCGGKEREKWMHKRQEELLPVPYFHVVFTLPSEFNPIAMSCPKQLYNTLFEAAWQTVRCFGQDEKHLGAMPGMIAILHTWGQSLCLHPHLHCIVPAGGLSKAGYWKRARTQGKYLFPVKAMSKVFRAKFMQALKAKLPLEKSLVNQVFKKPWVVYAKRPFGGPSAVLEYLGRYTHKIAISNHRITAIDQDSISFRYKDYRQEAANKEMKLEAMEFIRRFALHILPKGLVRIRHYGILSSGSKKQSIPRIYRQLKGKPLPTPDPRVLQTYDARLCTCCQQPTMRTIEILSRRGPPKLDFSKIKGDADF